MTVNVFDPGSVTALLGPTNTGKTHYAIERMLTHHTGVLGFPLRLLAREVYDRVVALRSPREVALITGEEKIVPKHARYFICTTESMPLDVGAAFVGVDEIQLCADADRGHVFTDRLLHARGTAETLFLGAATMRERITQLLPAARVLTRPRLSQLRYGGTKKLNRLPPRSAIVTFSVESVYAIAELLRRQHGGAAVVMGALSPRTRNAQVALYQNGDVDYLVATDAIGMGLNLDIQTVAFASLSKFDGQRLRRLDPGEMAQIAGRAGRYLNDGQFVTTAESGPLTPEEVEAIETHQFDPVKQLQWRNASLDFRSPALLLKSLEENPRRSGLVRARESEDVHALRQLAADSAIVARANGIPRTKMLWECCQIPDFRKTLSAEHVALVRKVFDYLSEGHGVIPPEWLRTQLAREDRTDGDIDTLSRRLARVRTWTYIANRSQWLAHAAPWREATRAVEDRLSDALHERLTQRFVDRRTSVLLRRLKEKEELVASVDENGAVTVDGEFVGRLHGFRFVPDASATGEAAKALIAAATQGLRHEVARRVEKFYTAPDSEFGLTEQGGLMWGGEAVGRLEKGGGLRQPRARAFTDEGMDPALVERIERRLQIWTDAQITKHFEPLSKLETDAEVTGLARGVAHQLIEALGVLPRQQIAEDVKALEQDARKSLRKHGIRFGQFTVFMQPMLKPAPTRWRLVLAALWDGAEELPTPPPAGHVTIPLEGRMDRLTLLRSGYRACGSRAVRIDMLERLVDLIRPLDGRAGFEATPEMLSITGTTIDQLADILAHLGYAGEKGERPRTRKPRSESLTPIASAQTAATDAEAAASEGAVSDSAAPPVEAAAPALVTDDSAEPVAMETFYIFRYQPRPRREVDPRRPRADGQPEGGGVRRRHEGGGDRAQGARPKGERSLADRPRREGGDRPRREGGSQDQGQRQPQIEAGTRPNPEGQRRPGKSDKRPPQQPRSFEAKPPKAVDPDSPFAILARLKDKR